MNEIRAHQQDLSRLSRLSSVPDTNMHGSDILLAVNLHKKDN